MLWNINVGRSRTFWVVTAKCSSSSAAAESTLQLQNCVPIYRWQVFAAAREQNWGFDTTCNFCSCKFNTIDIKKSLSAHAVKNCRSYFSTITHSNKNNITHLRSFYRLHWTLSSYSSHSIKRTYKQLRSKTHNLITICFRVIPLQKRGAILSLQSWFCRHKTASRFSSREVKLTLQTFAAVILDCGSDHQWEMKAVFWQGDVASDFPASLAWSYYKFYRTQREIGNGHYARAGYFHVLRSHCNSETYGCTLIFSDVSFC